MSRKDFEIGDLITSDYRKGIYEIIWMQENPGGEPLLRFRSVFSATFEPVQGKKVWEFWGEHCYKVDTHWIREQRTLAEEQCRKVLDGLDGVEERLRE